MTTYQLNTVIEMREHYRWISTSTAPTVTAKVTGVRANVLGGVTYALEFTSNKQMGGKPVQVMRLLTDRELDKQFVQVVKPAKKSRKPAARKVARTGTRAA